jgi:hypothetical protein
MGLGGHLLQSVTEQTNISHGATLDTGAATAAMTNAVDPEPLVSAATSATYRAHRGRR